MSVTVLLAGFGRFPGVRFNPSERLIKALARRRRPALTDVRLITHVFRTSYAAVEIDLPSIIARERPNVVLLFGVAARIKYVRIEMQARNRRSALFADGDGKRSTRLAIETEGAVPRAGRSPYHTVLQAVRASGLAAKLSRDAGRYLCNFAYWHALGLAAHSSGPQIVLFVHVPMTYTAPRRAKPKRRITANDLLCASEAILLTLVAAQRKSICP
ncbi:MAG TPA: pyroglutamyl-peptidase I [Xanthobacteraceae bacterium]|jgi:pyroglutamyl-peptidase|nr:pyroglutamyl-peptidase I [Xanthobacteraceae bacterium]